MKHDDKPDKPAEPCPFCGGHAAIRTFKKGRSKIGTPFWRGYVYCKGCEIRTSVERSPFTAIHKWNKRTTHD